MSMRLRNLTRGFAWLSLDSLTYSVSGRDSGPTSQIERKTSIEQERFMTHGIRPCLVQRTAIRKLQMRLWQKPRSVTASSPQREITNANRRNRSKSRLEEEAAL